MARDYGLQVIELIFDMNFVDQVVALCTEATDGGHSWGQSTYGYLQELDNLHDMMLNARIEISTGTGVNKDSPKYGCISSTKYGCTSWFRRTWLSKKPSHCLADRIDPSWPILFRLGDANPTTMVTAGTFSDRPKWRDTKFDVAFFFSVHRDTN